MQANWKLLQNLNRFKLITFDATDTLMKTKSPSKQYVDSAKELGIENITSEQIKKSFKEQFKYMNKTYPNFGRCSKSMDWEKWWKDVVKKSFISVDPNVSATKLNTLADNLVKIYGTKHCWTVLDDVPELLNKLKSAHKCLGVISNFDPRLKCILEDIKLLDYFNFVGSSYEIGWAKPQKEIFEEILKNYKIQPFEALHVGNTCATDYWGPRNAGWSSVLVANDPKKDSNNVEKGHSFTDMRDFITKLENETIEW